LSLFHKKYPILFNLVNKNYINCPAGSGVCLFKKTFLQGSMDVEKQSAAPPGQTQ
jgi:hypothetical protein